jgi:DNA-binding GntR family transcriptional regulator
MTGRVVTKDADKSLLKDRAYAGIKQRIQDGTFASGSFLSERQLASLLDMSKTPIKAAMQRLEQEGFVKVSPQQGIVVRELSVHEIADQFELRRALETFVVAAISGKLNPKQLSDFERNLADQAKAASQGSVARLVELDTEFHLLICEVFGNDAILECMLLHRAKIHRVISQVMSQAPDRLGDAVKEHVGIFKAIQKGKPELAVKLVERHLDFGKQYLLTSKWSS